MCSERGFTLLEVLIAALIGLVLVLGVGLLGESLERRRASTDSSSAAMTLAERQMEQLLALASPASASNLTAGTHGPGTPCTSPPCKITATGDTNTLTGPYLMQWTVVDNAASGTALIDPTSPSSTKKITVLVTHVSNPFIHATLQTYYKYR